MKRRSQVLFLVLTGVLLIAQCVVHAGAARMQDETGRSGKSEESSQPGGIRVGLFDSRAVAMAWYRSDEFDASLTKMREQLKQAQADGDEATVRKLEAAGPAMQALAHKQGFSTWPVDDILERIRTDIPKIGKEAGVDVIVSRWDVVWQRAGIEYVDVTDRLVQPFSPDAATLRVIREIRSKPPVPLDELKHHHD